MRGVGRGFSEVLELVGKLGSWHGQNSPDRGALCAVRTINIISSESTHHIVCKSVFMQRAGASLGVSGGCSAGIGVNESVPRVVDHPGGEQN